MAARYTISPARYQTRGAPFADLSYPFTFNMWVKFDNIAAGTRDFWWSWIGGFDQYIVVRKTGANLSFVNNGNAGGEQNVVLNGVIVANQWHNLSYQVEADGTPKRGWVDGGTPIINNIGNGSIPGLSASELNRSAGAGADAEMFSFSFWSDLLSQEQIDMLALGFHPMKMRPIPLHFWSIMGTKNANDLISNFNYIDGANAPLLAESRPVIKGPVMI